MRNKCIDELVAWASWIALTNHSEDMVDAMKGAIKLAVTYVVESVRSNSTVVMPHEDGKPDDENEILAFWCDWFKQAHPQLGMFKEQMKRVVRGLLSVQVIVFLQKKII